MGCEYTIMSRKAFYMLFSGTNKPRLLKCRIKVRTYGGRRELVLGAANVKVEHRGIAKMVAM